MKSENKLSPPFPGSSGATVKAAVTKDDARDPSKQHVISRAFNTTLGKPFRQNILKCEECLSLHYPPPPSTMVLPKKERPDTTHWAPQNPRN